VPAAPLPPYEARRLARLRALAVLDTACEPLFDKLAEAAAEVCGTPIALVSLVDEQRQWFKAGVGLPGVEETPRDAAFCAHAILGAEVMQVPDALADPRFVDNPLVLGEPHIRSYAGAPIVMPGGERIGTLCVIDRRVHALDPAQARQLALLADVAAQALLQRERIAEQTRAARAESEAALLKGLSWFRELASSAPVGLYHANAQGRLTWSNAQYQEITGLAHEQLAGDGWMRAVHAGDREAVAQAWRVCAEGGRPFDMRLRIVRPDGALRHVASRKQALHGPDGVLSGCQISGGGNITINGKFFEGGKKGQPAIVGASQLVVSATGALVGAVQQPAELTRFAFEPGCQLRMRISTANGSGNGGKGKK